MHQSMKDLIRNTNQAQAKHELDCIELAQRYSAFGLPWLAWSEAAFSAQARPVYKGMTKEDIAAHWLHEAIADTLVVSFDPARGLMVG